MKRDWSTALSWLLYVVAALWLASAIYDVVGGRSFAFPLLMAVLFGVLGTLWRILRSQRPEL
ncbi:hypothetical protein [Leifsonia sp. EB34]|uniref:hypothetical protein n=1 Tax=Leifsonia sp. EB34 TaxID=3156303 RepID=UPI0035158B47